MSTFYKFVSVFCIFLVLHTSTWESRAKAATIPDQYAAQIEWLQDGEQGFIPTCMKKDDLVTAYEDPRLQFFPLKLDEVRILWQHGPGYDTFRLRSQVYIYDGWGYLKYQSDLVDLNPGQNLVNLRTVTRIDGVRMPAILDYGDGPGFYIGILYISDLEHEVWEQSGHIVSSMDGAWEGYNIVWVQSEQAWFDAGMSGLPGNFGIRARFTPLCKKCIGDVEPFPDGDGDIDVYDQDLLAGYIGLDNVCRDARQYLDLNSDCYLTADDLDILNQNITGEGIYCDCQYIVTEPTSVQLNGVARTNIPDEVFTISNETGGELAYTLASEAEWMLVSPSQGSSTGEADEITLRFNTSSLLPGAYTSYIRIDANSGNSPYFLPVTINVMGNGDFDVDGDVDGSDMSIFFGCATGPELKYGTGNIPGSCLLTLTPENLLPADFDKDSDVDMQDFAEMQRLLTSTTGYASMMQSATKPALDIPEHLLRIPVLREKAELSIPTEVAGPRTAPKVQGTKKTTAWTIVGLVVFVLCMILIAILLWTAVIDPAWDYISMLGFMGGGSQMSVGDANRVRDALKIIETMKWHPEMNAIFLKLGEEKYANPEIHPYILINKQYEDDDETWIAAVFKVTGTICIHQTYVRGRRWTEQGVDGLMMVLIAEAQHLVHPEWSERQCQQQLERMRREIPRLREVALNIQHGSAEGSAKK